MNRRSVAQNVLDSLSNESSPRSAAWEGAVLRPGHIVNRGWLACWLYPHSKKGPPVRAAL